MKLMTNLERDVQQVAHHYRESGHNDVWLVSGFVRKTRDGEEYVGVDHVEDARRAIERTLEDDWTGCGPWKITKVAT